MRGAAEPPSRGGDMSGGVVDRAAVEEMMKRVLRSVNLRVDDERVVDVLESALYQQVVRLTSDLLKISRARHRLDMYCLEGTAVENPRKFITEQAAQRKKENDAALVSKMSTGDGADDGRKRDGPDGQQAAGESKKRKAGDTKQGSEDMKKKEREHMNRVVLDRIDSIRRKKRRVAVTSLEQSNSSQSNMDRLASSSQLNRIDSRSAADLTASSGASGAASRADGAPASESDNNSVVNLNDVEVLLEETRTSYGKLAFPLLLYRLRALARGS